MVALHPTVRPADLDDARDRIWASLSPVSPLGSDNVETCTACGQERRVTEIRRVTTFEGELWVTVCRECLGFAMIHGVDELMDRNAAIRAQAAAGEESQLCEEWEVAAA